MTLTLHLRWHIFIEAKRLRRLSSRFLCSICGFYFQVVAILHRGDQGGDVTVMARRVKYAGVAMPATGRVSRDTEPVNTGALLTFTLFCELSHANRNRLCRMRINSWQCRWQVLTHSSSLLIFTLNWVPGDGSMYFHCAVTVKLRQLTVKLNGGLITGREKEHFCKPLE